MEIFTPPVVKEKRPPGRQPTHTPEFMIMVARKVVEGEMTYREASKTFGISHGAVSSYVKKYKNDDLNSKRRGRVGKHKDAVESYRHEAQLRELKQEIAELYLENLMLKKALKHSIQLKKSDSSVITSENFEQFKEDVE